MFIDGDLVLVITMNLLERVAPSLPGKDPDLCEGREDRDARMTRQKTRRTPVTRTVEQGKK